MANELSSSARERVLDVCSTFALLLVEEKSWYLGSKCEDFSVMEMEIRI